MADKNQLNQIMIYGVKNFQKAEIDITKVL